MTTTKDAIIRQATLDAIGHQEEFPGEPITSDWDAEAWTEARQELGLADEDWPTYHDALHAAVTKMAGNLSAPLKLELCPNTEALRDWCGLDWSGVEQGYEDEACEQFVTEVWNTLESIGFEVVRAKGQRTTCHGWHGANTFAWKSGPIGTFGNPQAADKQTIEQIIDRVNESVRHEWTFIEDED